MAKKKSCIEQQAHDYQKTLNNMLKKKQITEKAHDILTDKLLKLRECEY